MNIFAPHLAPAPQPLMTWTFRFQTGFVIRQREIMSGPVTIWPAFRNAILADARAEWGEGTELVGCVMGE